MSFPRSESFIPASNATYSSIHRTGSSKASASHSPKTWLDHGRTAVSSGNTDEENVAMSQLETMAKETLCSIAKTLGVPPALGWLKFDDLLFDSRAVEFDIDALTGTSPFSISFKLPQGEEDSVYLVFEFSQGALHRITAKEDSDEESGLILWAKNPNEQSTDTGAIKKILTSGPSGDDPEILERSPVSTSVSQALNTSTPGQAFSRETILSALKNHHEHEDWQDDLEKTPHLDTIVAFGRDHLDAALKEHHLPPFSGTLTYDDLEMDAHLGIIDPRSYAQPFTITYTYTPEDDSPPITFDITFRGTDISIKLILDKAPEGLQKTETTYEAPQHQNDGLYAPTPNEENNNFEEFHKKTDLRSLNTQHWLMVKSELNGELEKENPDLTRFNLQVPYIMKGLIDEWSSKDQQTQNAAKATLNRLSELMGNGGMSLTTQKAFFFENPTFFKSRAPFLYQEFMSAPQNWPLKDALNLFSSLPKVMDTSNMMPQITQTYDITSNDVVSLLFCLEQFSPQLNTGNAPHPQEEIFLSLPALSTNGQKLFMQMLKELLMDYPEATLTLSVPNKTVEQELSAGITLPENLSFEYQESQMVASYPPTLPERNDPIQHYIQQGDFGALFVYITDSKAPPGSFQKAADALGLDVVSLQDLLSLSQDSGYYPETSNISLDGEKITPSTLPVLEFFKMALEDGSFTFSLTHTDQLGDPFNAIQAFLDKHTLTYFLEE